MTIEYLPVGIKCNLKCTYCYQEPMREAGNFAAPLNFVRVKQALERTGTDFALFGGEPLLAPMDHLDEIFAYGYEKHKKNGIQTNGLLISPSHVELFKKYNVQVGVSIDGPGELNRARCNDFDTQVILDNIRDLMRERVPTSLIVTIHALNFKGMERLLCFFSEMESIGLRYINLHNLEVDNQETDATLYLNNDENYDAFTRIYDYSKGGNVLFQPFDDINKLLTAPKPSTACIWGACDPLTTPAVHGVDPAGNLTNCGRTNKDGINYLKSSGSSSLERYQALSRTHWEKGGCKDCDFFFACKGQCPGTAIDGDWRNRTRDCEFWWSLIAYQRLDLVKNGVQVLDLDKANAEFINQIECGSCGSSSSSPHGDIPHGDSHGDHTDYTTTLRRDRELTTGVR